MESSDINVYNLHEHFQYKLLIDPPRNNPRIFITWDESNNQLHSLMNNEYSVYHSGENYTNSMWVNEMKKVINWKQGQSIMISIYLYPLPTQMAIYLINPYAIHYAYLVINEDGYLMLKLASSSRKEDLKRCNCLYNDLLDETMEPYIFK